MVTIKSLLIFSTFFLCALPLTAEELKPLRKWVVFPFKITDESLNQAGEQAWWKLREKITEKKRYMVASRQLLIQKDVYTPRTALKSEDVKYLSQLLEADLLITGFSEYRDITIQVYLAQSGQLLWSKKLGFHPSLKATDQLTSISLKMISEFLDQIPYQGFVVDSEEKTKNIVTVDIGNNDFLKEGDEIKFFSLDYQIHESEKMSFDDFEKNIISEGKVTKVKKKYALVEVKRNWEGLVKDVFVGLPREIKQAEYQEQLSPEMIPTPIEEENPSSHSKHFTIFGSLIGLLAILILAF